MQSSNKKIPPLGIVFDSAMGRKIDDVLTLGFIFGLEGKSEPEIRVISITISHGNLKAAAFCDAMAWFFTDWKQREIPKRFRRRHAWPGGGKALPVGLLIENSVLPDTPMLTSTLSQKDTDGKLSYRHGINKISDTADVAAVIRNAFTSEHDQNTTVILTGPATNLARLLSLRGAKELIKRKVQLLVVEAGTHPGGDPDYNITLDIPAAQKLFVEWPTPIVVVGAEVGHTLNYPASSIESDFHWTDRHPVVDAYRAYKTMPYNAAASGMAAALYAIRPEAGYFDVSEPGLMSVLDDGRTKFTPSKDGYHRYLSVNLDQKEEVKFVFEF